MITYNKEYVKKDGRVLVSSGPRNMQNRSAIDAKEILELRAELDALKSRLADPQPTVSAPTAQTIQGFSQEQVDELVNKTAIEVSEEVSTDYKKMINEYKTEIENLKDKLANKDHELLNIRNNYEEQLSASRERITRQQSAFEERESNLYLKLDEKDKTIKDLTDKLAAISTRPVNVISTTGEVPSTEEQGRPSMDNIYIDPSKKGDENKLESHVVTSEVKSDNQKVTSDVDKLKSLMGGLPKRN